MERTTLGLAGALSALLAIPAAGGAQASETPVPRAQSFSELLEPIPNAALRLKLADAEERRGGARLIQAQYHHHHHHHHHAHYYRRHRVIRHIFRAFVPPPVNHHHHHHHHHHNHY